VAWKRECHDKVQPGHVLSMSQFSYKCRYRPAITSLAAHDSHCSNCHVIQTASPFSTAELVSVSVGMRCGYEAVGMLLLHSLSCYIRSNRAETTTRTERADISELQNLFCESLVYS
jgi:hypothetical protein